MHAFNLPNFQCMGIVVLGVGVWALVDEESLRDLIVLAHVDGGVNIFGVATILLMVLASLAIVVSFLGCWGAVKENKLVQLVFFSFWDTAEKLAF